MRFGVMAAAAAAACVVAVPADAATFVVDLEVDVQARIRKAEIVPFSAGVGDIIVLTVTGINGARVILPALFRNSVSDYIGSGLSASTQGQGVASLVDYEFTGLAGNGFRAFGSYSTPPVGDATIGLVRNINGSDVSFDSFRQTFTIQSGTNITFRKAVFEASAFVPEPSTWALMILGFGAVGGAMRRRPARLRHAGK